MPTPAIPEGELTLAGPAERLDAAHWPVRGDLAHIALAGRCFVLHYAVPMRHRVSVEGALLHQAGHDAAEVLARLGKGTGFDVLDMAGGWAWGQVGEEGLAAAGPMTGLVGYVALAALEAVS